MHIWFTNNKVQKLFNSEKALRKKYGERMATLIGVRLAGLSACSSFQVAFEIPGKLHPLSGSGSGQFAMNLVHPQRLIIEPANEPLPYLEDDENSLDYKQIDEVEIIGVIDYH